MGSITQSDTQFGYLTLEIFTNYMIIIHQIGLAKYFCLKIWDFVIVLLLLLFILFRSKFCFSKGEHKYVFQNMQTWVLM